METENPAYFEVVKVIDLSVIIVSYNVKEFLQQCIMSVHNSIDHLTHEIIVIDNNSVDGTPNIIAQRYPNVKLIANPINRGFAAACNQGLKLARGRFILLLNPDTMLQEDTIPTMIQFLQEHPEVGAAGCKILNPDGTLQLACRRSFPTPAVAIPKVLGLSTLFPKSKAFARYNLTYLNPDQITEVDAVSGSFLFFRRDVYEKIGGLDEDFFLYGEDLDFCYRIKQAGWKIYYLPTTKIIHYKGESTKLAAFDNFITFYRAMDIFVKKHFNAGYSAIISLFLRLGIVGRAVLALFVRLMRKRLALLFDGVIIVGAILVAHRLQMRPLPNYETLISMLVFYLLLWLGTGYAVGIYDRKELSYSQAVVTAVLGFFISLIINVVFQRFIYSPRLIAWAFLFIAIFLPGWRILLLFLQRHCVIAPTSLLSKALLSRRTIIMGAGREGERIARKLRAHIEHGFEVLGFVDKEYITEPVAGLPFLGVVDDLPEIIRINRASELIFSTDRFNNDDILSLIDEIRPYRLNLKIVPRQLDYILGKSSVENIEDLPLYEVDYNYFHAGNRLAKRTFDWLAAALLSIISAPLILTLVALRRYKLHKVQFLGVDGSHFNGYVLQRRNGQNNSRHFISNLPLLWSILDGKLSFVGSELKTVDRDGRLLRCKPGLTGLYHIQNHHPLDDNDYQNFEHYYLQNHTFFLDIEIILKTILNI